jgi:aspartate aminotransferase-like enzyme
MQQAVALRMIKEETNEKIWERHAILSKSVREGIKALGLELFAKENPAIVLTSVVMPKGLDSKALVKSIRDNYGISMAGGQGKMLGLIFRIGTLGFTDRFDAVMGVAAVEMALKDMGADIEVGKGVKKTMEVLMAEYK